VFTAEWKELGMKIKLDTKINHIWWKGLPVIMITMLLLSVIFLDAMAGGISANTSPIRKAVNQIRSMLSLEESLGLVCTDDVHGANDEPGQKDLTRMCVDSQVDPLEIQFQWDEIYGGGANTYDACNMFDTDSDGYINYSLCVQVLANPGTDLMEYYNVILYSCGDDKSDRCTQPVSVLPISPGTACTVAQKELDPFPAGTAYPQDTVGECNIVWADVGGEDSVYVNTCSFPSGQPNSDPSDCITEPGSGFITIVKEADPDLESAGFQFIINDGETDIYTTTIYGSGTSDRYAMLEGIYSVSEILPPDWTLENVACVDSDQNPVGVPNYELDGVYEINLSASDDITCTFADILLLTPSLTTTPNPDSGYVNDILQDSAQLSGGYNPSGTIMFELYDPSDPTCVGEPAYSETVPVSGSGIYNTSTGYQANMAGTWRWVAIYSGDNYNNPVSSGCNDEQVTIIKYTSTTTTLPDPASGYVGDMLNDTATVTSDNSPSGQVTFKLYEPGDTTCQSPVFTETVDLVDGSASTTTGYMAGLAGTWRWTADYSGDYANFASSSGCNDELVVIGKASPNITTQPDPADGIIGVRLHDTATVTGGFNPTGMVTFRLFEPGDTTCTSPVHTETVDLVGGSAATEGGFLSNQAGVWRWTAEYSGDINNNSDVSGCQDELVTIEPYRLYFPILTHDHVTPWCNLVAKQIAPSSYTVEAYVDWEWAAPVNALSESTSEDTPGIHRIKWGDDSHTTFTGEKGEATFYHTYGLSGWYEVVVMLWGTDGNKYFPCSQWVDPPPQLVVPVEN
jgi:hypothetical protein